MSYPCILIKCKPNPESEAGFDLDVKTGGGINSQDEIVALLLALVERLTGVPADLYAQEIEIARPAR